MRLSWVRYTLSAALIAGGWFCFHTPRAAAEDAAAAPEAKKEEPAKAEGEAAKAEGEAPKADAPKTEDAAAESAKTEGDAAKPEGETPKVEGTAEPAKAEGEAAKTEGETPKTEDTAKTDGEEANPGDVAAKAEPEPVEETAKDTKQEEKREVKSGKEAAEKATAEELAKINKLIDSLRISSSYRDQAQAKDDLITMGPMVAPFVLPVLDNGSAIAKVFAILILRDVKAPESYSALYKLLGSNDPQLRYHASLSLVAMTNRDFGYFYNDLPENREAAMKRWSAFLVESQFMTPPSAEKTPSASSKTGETSAPAATKKKRSWWKSGESKKAKPAPKPTAKAPEPAPAEVEAAADDTEDDTGVEGEKKTWLSSIGLGDSNAKTEKTGRQNGVRSFPDPSTNY